MGISYAVVTKVKELTEEKRYGEAFDLLQGEDIFQSLNPQFLRSCGKTYLETGHYPEAREALVKSHIMAPESTRIIYDLVHLYSKMGYYTRANNYYHLYEYFTSEQDVGRLYLQYMLKKAQRVEAKELLAILERACEDDYSDEWGFELALLYASLGMQQKCKEECIHLKAAFKQSPYVSLADSLKKGDYDIANSNYSFPLVEIEEDRTVNPELLALEDEQWKKDDLLIHPPEAVILQMEDDDEPEENSDVKAGKKEKGFRLPFGHRRDKSRSADKQEIDKPESEETETKDSELKEPKAEDTAPIIEAGRIEQHETIINDNKDNGLLDDEKSDAEPLRAESLDRDKSGKESSMKEKAVEDESFEDQSEQKVSDQKTSKRDDSEQENSQPEASVSDVSSYIESVMRSVADIEASVAEELKHPIKYDTEVRRDSHKETDQDNLHDDNPESDVPEPVKEYQPKLNEVDSDLSPKERLEKLMRLIEEDRNEEEQKKPDIYEEEELDMDEFLMNLVGASAITDAMVKNYHKEQDQEIQAADLQDRVT